MQAHLPLSPRERDRIVAEARRLRAEALASLFRAVGRTAVRLFAMPARIFRPVRSGPAPDRASARAA